MIQQAIERFGHIDILVNNAGLRPGPDRVPVVELSEAAWDQMQNVNAKGTFLCAQAVARHMIERGGGGKIVNISSTAGRLGMPRFAAYCASKFAVIGFTQSLAHEVAEHKINVNAVCPSTTLTERTDYITAALNKQDAPTRDATQTMVSSSRRSPPRPRRRARGRCPHRGLFGLGRIRLYHRRRPTGRRWHTNVTTKETHT
jgi:NAD(P)-dependent dehydrogenase (short-subunit alcohol dehydrogenase family)